VQDFAGRERVRKQFDFLIDYKGAGNREQGTGSREQGAGSREQGAGSRE
jgi:hypothetical protein